MLFSDSPKTLLRELCLLLGLAGALELGLRVFAPEYGHKLFDNEYTGSYPLAFNQDDYRGPRVPRQKPAGEYRVLALGDSETLGTGVKADQTWPAALGKALVGRGRPSNVINGAMEGSGLGDIALAWNIKWRQYEPDAVVVGLTTNMVSLCAVRRQEVTPDEYYREHHRPLTGLRKLRIEANRAVQMAYLPSFASVGTQFLMYRWGLLNHNIDPHFPMGPMLAYGWLQGDVPPKLAEAAWQKFAVDLARLKSVVEETGAKFFIVWLPPRFELSDSWWDNQKNVPRERFSMDPATRVREIAEKGEFELVDSTTALRAFRHQAARTGRQAPLFIHFDFVHYDEEGHRAVASAIAPLL